MTPTEQTVFISFCTVWCSAVFMLGVAYTASKYYRRKMRRDRERAARAAAPEVERIP